MISVADIQRVFTGSIRLQEPLSAYSVFGTGGPADCVLAPASAADAGKILNHLHQKRLPFTVLNQRSNAIVSDDGFRGIVLNFDRHLLGMECRQKIVTAEAGVRLVHLIDFAILHSLGGLEMCAGIPGTVGECLAARPDLFESGDGHIVALEISRGGEMLTLKSTTRNPAVARFDPTTDVLLGVSVALSRTGKPALLQRRREALLARNEREPLNIPRAGRIFRDPADAAAAALVARAGMAGRRIGGAAVFTRYPNYIVTDTRATSADIVELLHTVQHAVKHETGHDLDPEVHLIGFEEHVPAGVA